MGSTHERLLSNQSSFYVFEEEQLLAEWQHRNDACYINRPPLHTQQIKSKEVSVQDFFETVHSNRSNISNFQGGLSTTQSALKIARELGFTGKAYIKNYGGKNYVILKGVPGQRPNLTGTRYLASNPKVAKLGIGKTAGLKSIKSGMVITMVVFTTINVLNYIANDDATLTSLIGTTTSDLIKVTIVSLIAAGTMVAVGTVTTVAAAPFIAAFVVGVGVGMALDMIDEKYGLTEKLIEALDAMQAKISQTKQNIYDSASGMISDFGSALVDSITDSVERKVRAFIYDALRGFREIRF